jgi:hypothetical protein
MQVDDAPYLFLHNASEELKAFVALKWWASLLVRAIAAGESGASGRRG